MAGPGMSPHVRQRSNRRSMVSNRVDPAVEALGLVFRAGGEEEGVGGLVVEAVAESDAPEAVDVDDSAARSAQEALETPTDVGRMAVAVPVLAGLEGADAPVAEVADQELVAVAAEVVGRLGDAPGGVERAAAGDARDHVAVGVE